MLTILQTQTTTDRVVLKRGPQMMVLFRGCPRTKDVEPLHEAGVTIGLALAPRELPKVPRLDAYRYVFISTGRRALPILAEAIADLERNGWTVEADTDAAAEVESHSPRLLLAA